MKVVGVAGQYRNGKDCVADYLAMNLGWERSAFAKNVKQVFMDTFDVSWDFVEEWKVKPDPPPGFKMPIRQGLQFIGDGFRKIQGNIWIELAFRRMTKPSIISDVRYINELSKINDVDGVSVLVYRPGYINDDPNGSEAEIRPIVEWFRDTGLEGNVVEQFLEQQCGPLDDFGDVLECCTEVPNDCLKVDLFIINDGKLDDLYDKCGNIIIPFVKKKYEI